MKKIWTEEELKQIASQLSAPEGEMGKKTGERMALSNGNMIKRTIELLDLKEGENVLEIGHGNGSHVPELLAIAEGIHYTGTDISATMIAEAIHINTSAVESEKAAFVLSDGNLLNFPDASFDKIFTVNTLYFWKDPIAFAKEIYRVLKPGGSFCNAFAHKKFMEQLPFTKWGFRLYTIEMLWEILQEAGFSIAATCEEKDNTQSNLGTEVERDIVVITARR